MTWYSTGSSTVCHWCGRWITLMSPPHDGGPYDIPRWIDPDTIGTDRLDCPERSGSYCTPHPT